MSWGASTRFVPRPRVAVRYAVGALAFGCAALFAGWWAILPGWIALALAILAASYWWIGPRVYGKRNGRIPAWVRVLLAPHMIGVWLVRKWQFRRMKRPFDAICQGVILGRMLQNAEAARAVSERGITAVLDVCAEHAETPAFRALCYENTAVLDVLEPSPAELDGATEFIQQHAADGCVYVHCALGKSRSAVVVAAFLLRSGHAASVDEACAMVKDARPCVKFTPRLIQSLRDFAAASMSE
jgi:hypothetical protein